MLKKILRYKALGTLLCLECSKNVSSDLILKEFEQRAADTNLNPRMYRVLQFESRIFDDLIKNPTNTLRGPVLVLKTFVQRQKVLTISSQSIKLSMF